MTITRGQFIAASFLTTEHAETGFAGRGRRWEVFASRFHRLFAREGAGDTPVLDPRGFLRTDFPRPAKRVSVCSVVALPTVFVSILHAISRGQSPVAASWQSSGMHPGSLQRMWMSNGEDGRFYQDRSGMKLAIYPGEDEDRRGDEAWKYEHPAEDGNSGAERAKWCVFSFVTRAKSLAIGQLPMSGCFTDNANLEGDFSCGSDHYYHSWEFRSNCWRTSPLWTDILHHIKKEPDGKTK